MTDAPTHATVLNTTVLSNFAQVDHVKLLLTVPRVVTVTTVEEELEAGIESHPHLEHAVNFLEDDIPVIAPSASAKTLEEQLLETLDPGEAQALAIAESTEGLIVTDDGDARATAQQCGVDLTGSIGFLVRFVEDDHISAATADTYLKRWIDSGGFRSPARDFEVFLEE